MICTKCVKRTAVLLTAIGGLNWGLIGLFGFNLVTYLANLIGLPVLENIIYVVVGISAVVVLVFMAKKMGCGEACTMDAKGKK